MLSIIKISKIFLSLNKRASIYGSTLEEPILVYIEQDPNDLEEIIVSHQNYRISESKTSDGEQTVSKGVLNLLSVMQLEASSDLQVNHVGKDGEKLVFVVSPPNYDWRAWFFAEVEKQQESEPVKPRKTRKEPIKEEETEDVSVMPSMGLVPRIVQQKSTSPEVRRKDEHIFKYVDKDYVSPETRAIEEVKRRNKEKLETPPIINPRGIVLTDSIEDYIDLMNNFAPGSVKHGDEIISAVIERKIAEAGVNGETLELTPIITLSIDDINLSYYWENGKYVNIIEPYTIRFDKRKAAIKKWRYDDWVSNNKNKIQSKDRSSLLIVSPGSYEHGNLFKLIDGNTEIWYKLYNNFYKRIKHDSITASLQELEPFGRMVVGKSYDDGDFGLILNKIFGREIKD